MIGYAAVLLLLVVMVLVALPGVIALSLPRASLIAAGFYTAILTLLVIYYSGFSISGTQAGPDEGAAPAGAPLGLCNQAILQSEQGGLIIDRTNPREVRVSQSLWRQLPQQAKDGLTRCLEASRPSGSANEPLRIVEVGGR